MRFARIARIAFLAFILPVAALVFPTNAWAASGNVQVCQPNASCTVGEFLYDDSYAPLTSATCTITSRYPDGTTFLNAQALTVSTQGDAWYAKDITTPATQGIYRTQICCTVGSSLMCLDKTFQVKNDVSVPSTSDIAAAVWGYSSRSLTTLGTFVSDIWNNTTRTLTGATLTSGSLATKSDVEANTTVNKEPPVSPVSAETIQSMRKQATALEKPLEKTAFFAQGVTLQSDIDVSLDKIEALQKNVTTPEEKILAYREANIEMKGAQAKLEKLKDLVTQASSARSLLGFVGGSQAIAAWGVIIVMTIGFVFLTLYLRTISGNIGMVGKKAVQKRQKNDVVPERVERKNGYRRRFITIILLVAGGTSLIGVITFSRFHSKPAVTQESAPPPIAAKHTSDQKSILGSHTVPPQNLTAEAQVSVPRQATVSLRDTPTTAVATPSSTFQLVTVSDAVDTFLTVRNGPGGKAIGKVLPGAKYPRWDSKHGWIQIVLDDGSLGWVSAAYVL